MTGKRAPALHRDLLHHAAQLAHPRVEFQSELPALDAGGGALVRRPDRFFSIIFGNVDRIGDWTKWEVVLLIGTHQMIAQLFQAFFFVNVAAIPELVRTGKLDSLLVLPVDSQFAVSTKQFGLDSVVNAALGGVVVVVALAKLSVVPTPMSILLYVIAIGFGIAVHYSIMLSLAAVSFWIVRAQGPGLRLLQFPQHRALSGRDLSAALQNHLRVDYSGRDRRQYSRAATDQIVRPALAAHVSARRRLDRCLLPLPRFLVVCPSPILQRQLLKPVAASLCRGENTATERRGYTQIRQISPCAD